MRHWFAGLALVLIAPAFIIPNALAQSLLTEKRFFTLPSYTTQHGKPIRNVRVGFETHGGIVEHARQLRDGVDRGHVR